MTQNQRRLWLQRFGIGAAAAGSAAIWGAAKASSWPTRPLRLIVPFNVGTPPDIVSRLLAQLISPGLGQPVVVENRPGAIGIVGLNEMLRQPADGHTLFCLLMPVTTAKALLPNQRIDLVADTEPVIQVDWNESVLVVSREVPARSVRELIELLRAKPNQLSFGSGGNGTPAHLTAEVFKAQQQVSAVHVPYAQFMQAVPDLMNNRIQFMFLTSTVAVPQVKSGKLAALAVVGAQRLAALPEVPTMAEAGFGDFDTRSWDGIIVKAGTPREVVERLNREIRTALETPQVRERFAELGMVPAPGTPQQFGELIRREITRWTEVIRAAGIRAE
ncbi:MAG: Bug family tripartite tricarboxylate transporter substrate binding protein [Burkholderiaceae bacterium]